MSKKTNGYVEFTYSPWYFSFSEILVCTSFSKSSSKAFCSLVMDRSAKSSFMY